MKVAFVHDWIVSQGGSEKVLKNLLELYPGPIFTLFTGKDHPFKGRILRTSFLQRLPGIEKNYRNLLPLFPLALKSFNLSSFDLILSSSHCVAKSVPIRSGQKHICYCHTPMRYAWQPSIAGMGWTKKGIASPLLALLRRFDRKTSERVDHFIANSTHVANRIQKFYGRRAEVIHPPVDTDVFSICRKKGNYYFTSCRLVPYKRIDLLLEAFQRLPNETLWIAGDGPERGRLQSKASKNVCFLGYLSEQKYRDTLSAAKGYVHAGEEDFGIAMAEAQSAGVPVIAYGVGGSRDIVIAGETGIFFDRQSPESIVTALEEFQRGDFDPHHIKRHAEQFSRQQFLEKMKSFIRCVC